MPYKDLRSFLRKLDEYGELERFEGADWNLEIGVISELGFERQGSALLFDQIKGYPPGHVVVSNLCTTERRSLLALELSLDLSFDEVMAWWKKLWCSFQPMPPVVVSSGPVEENVLRGEQVNLFAFPTPLWHELDGGRYIGTGSVVINRDPDSGWVNLGTYRIMIHDRHTAGIFMEPYSHGRMIASKYWQKGQPCPVAVSLGQDPIVFLAAASQLGRLGPGVSEYDFCGYVRGRPVDVIPGRVTGLPVPATAEIVLEGEIPPPAVEEREEGPFGEWTGYYAHGRLSEPVLKVHAIYHRQHPILWGAPPLKPTYGFYAFGYPFILLSSIWTAFEEAGIKGISRIRDLSRLGAIVVAIKQEDERHVKEIVEVLSRVRSLNKVFIIVDDDIDVDNPRDVIWAIGTRCEPEKGIKIVSGSSAWQLDPLITPELRKKKAEYPVSRVVIDACKPYSWMNDFPATNVFSKGLREHAWHKWNLGKKFGEIGISRTSLSQPQPKLPWE